MAPLCVAGLPHRVLKEVVPLLEFETIASGAMIFEMGNPGDKVYILMQGSVALLKGKHVLSRMSVGHGGAATSALGLPIFGELALLDRRPRTTAALATAECKLLVLPVEHFASCTMLIPDFKTRLRRLRSERKAGASS